MKTLALVAAVAFASPAHGQMAGFGFGQYLFDDGSQMVAEMSVAVVAGPIVPNLLLTFDLSGSGMPIIQPQIGRTVAGTEKTELVLDAGLSSGPDDYAHWEPHLAVSTIAALHGPVRASFTVAFQPWNAWARSSVLKIGLAF